MAAAFPVVAQATSEWDAVQRRINELSARVAALQRAHTSVPPRRAPALTATSSDEAPPLRPTAPHLVFSLNTGEQSEPPPPAAASPSAPSAPPLPGSATPEEERLALAAFTEALAAAERAVLRFGDGGSVSAAHQLLANLREDSPRRLFFTEG